MSKKQNSFLAGQFKAQCLQLIDEVNQHRTSIVITKHSKPFAMLVPIKQEKRSLFGCLKDSVVMRGDIVSGTGGEWEADA